MELLSDVSVEKRKWYRKSEHSVVFQSKLAFFVPCFRLPALIIVVLFVQLWYIAASCAVSGQGGMLSHILGVAVFIYETKLFHEFLFLSFEVMSVRVRFSVYNS